MEVSETVQALEEYLRHSSLDVHSLKLNYRNRTVIVKILIVYWRIK